MIRLHRIMVELYPVLVRIPPDKSHTIVSLPSFPSYTLAQTFFSLNALKKNPVNNLYDRI